MTRVLLLELNEINFDQVRAYAGRGKLPTLANLIAAHGVTETTSEQRYEELEPWIQWVTAHTGLTLAEHGVFRLGDIVDHDIPQIWELLEAKGLRVGAVSPMNSKNRCEDAAFFMPDPWTCTEVTGSIVLRKLSKAVSQAVNDNAQARIAPSSVAWLAAGALLRARPANYLHYLSMTGSALRRRPWAKAMFLDQLLADVFIGEVSRKRPDFASLFLNAGAHIQHHYMFNSQVYSGPHVNPEWYVARDADPLLEVYELYDRIVRQVASRFPEARLMLATGLHQDPHPSLTFYWRLKNHAAFLTKAEVPFRQVEPRMSRDFVVHCADADEAAAAERKLMQIRAADGTPLFEVDNRGDSLFVMLTWPHDIPADFEYLVGNCRLTGFRGETAFVAVKNGGHNGIGYFLDSGEAAPTATRVIPLTSLPQRIADACGVDWSPAPA